MVKAKQSEFKPNEEFAKASMVMRAYRDKISQEVYMGPTQRDAIETLIIGLITKGAVLLEGTHGTYKTSMSKYFASLFTKPMYQLKFIVDNTEQLKGRLHLLAVELGVDEDSLARNLLAGVDVQYSQYGSKIETSVNVNALKYRIKGETVRVPLDIYVRQVNTASEAEDVVGYGIDNPLLLRDAPPHVVKRGYMGNADFVVLDEVFKNPRLISVIHNYLNDREYDTIVGTGHVDTEGLVLLTNPLNDNYQTNISMVDFASLDRYMFSAFVSPPTGQEIMIMQENFKRAKIEPLPIETLYAARMLYQSVQIPGPIQVFMMGFLAALSKCYFTIEGKRHIDGKDVFAVEHNCELCQYGGVAGETDWSICSKANVGKVRANIAIMNALRAHAFLEGRAVANDEDLRFALKHSLPHRIKWSPDFKDDPITSTERLIESYVKTVKNFADQFDAITKLILNPSPDAFMKMRNDNRDVPALLAFIDEYMDMIKERAMAKGDKATLAKLEKQVKLNDALKTFEIGERSGRNAGGSSPSSASV